MLMEFASNQNSYRDALHMQLLLLVANVNIVNVYKIQSISLIKRLAYANMRKIRCNHAAYKNLKINAHNAILDFCSPLTDLAKKIR